MIDNRAIIHPSARIMENVQIGPYTVIGADVEIGAGCKIGPHVVINGPTRIGKDNHIFQFASIGEAPQDKKYKDEDTLLEIGDGNTIREFCTLNRGTVQGGGVTRIGNHNWIMAYVHIAHDCIVGSHTVFANNASLAGHVEVEDYVGLAGFAGVHQYCRIGSYSFVAKGSYVVKDILPYVLVSGYDTRVYGLNVVGLKRSDFSLETIEHLRRAYRIVFRQGLTVPQSVAELEKLLPVCQEVQCWIDALQQSTRGIVR